MGGVSSSHLKDGGVFLLACGSSSHGSGTRVGGRGQQHIEGRHGATGTSCQQVPPLHPAATGTAAWPSRPMSWMQAMVKQLGIDHNTRGQRRASVKAGACLSRSSQLMPALQALLSIHFSWLNSSCSFLKPRNTLLQC